MSEDLRYVNRKQPVSKEWVEIDSKNIPIRRSVERYFKGRKLCSFMVHLYHFSVKNKVLTAIIFNKCSFVGTLKREL